MDLDFHFGTIYVLSRWSHFGSENSKLIAASSQLVDDNLDENSFSDKHENELIANGVRVRYSCQNIWNSLTGKGNCEVWVPFHFLPGLEGNTTDEQLICKKHSVLANKLRDRLLETSLDTSTFAFRLGVGFHVWADTWAHQEFAGINTAINKVQNLIFATPGAGMQESILDFIKSHPTIGDIVQKLDPLGHVAAAHCPDLPFLWWKTSKNFSEGRKNWVEFMEASDEIFRVLQEVSCEEVTGLSDEQKELLRRSFQELAFNDINDRYNGWIDRIHDNFFEIEDFDEGDENVAYDVDDVMSDIDFCRAFYDEINDHFDWVKGELEDFGIDILKSEPIY